VKSRVLLFLTAFLAWTVLSWVPDWQHLVVGLLVAVFVAWLTGDLFVKQPHMLSRPSRYFYFVFYYVPVLIWECLKANLDVALRVINPKLPIRPGIVKIQTSLKSDTGLTFLANSITLTPGTMSVDIDRDRGLLYIHWIDVKATDVEAASARIAGRFEPIFKKIFE